MTKKTRCPACGIWHAIEEEPKANTFENRVRRPFRTDALMPTMPQQPGIITEQPTGLPGWDSHVRIPLRQAMISGLLDAPIWFAVGAGGTGILLVVVDAMPVDVAFTPMGLLVISGSVGAIAGLVAFCQTAKKEWPVRLGYYDALLWIEEVTGLDLDGDGEVGEPEAETLKIELVDKNGIPRLLAEFDTDPERFKELARLILVVRKGFSEETASEAGYSRKEWVSIRDRFFNLEAAAWKNRNHPKQGIDLRQRGVDLLTMALSPTLPAGSGSKNTPGTDGQRRTDDLSNRFDHIKGAR